MLVCVPMQPHVRAAQQEIASNGVDNFAFRLMSCQTRSRATPLIGIKRCAAQPPTLLEVLDRTSSRISGSRIRCCEQGQDQAKHARGVLGYVTVHSMFSLCMIGAAFPAVWAFCNTDKPCFFQPLPTALKLSSGEAHQQMFDEASGMEFGAGV